MVIIYQDEYGVEIYRVQSQPIPDIGEIVTIFDISYYVQTREYFPEHTSVLVTVSDHKKSDTTKTSMYNESAITNNRLVKLEKEIAGSNKKINTLNHDLNNLKNDSNMSNQV